MSDFKYTVSDDLNDIFYEKGNKFLALREIQWGDRSDYKIDIRRYYTPTNGRDERMDKGISMSREEADELTHSLVRNNFGNTNELLKSLTQRDDFNGKISDDGTLEDLGIVDDSNYYDPEEIFNGLGDE